MFQECRTDRTTAEPKLMELLKDTDVLLEKLMETEVETYGEINVRLSGLVNLILHHEPEIYLA